MESDPTPTEPTPIAEPRDHTLPCWLYPLSPPPSHTPYAGSHMRGLPLALPLALLLATTLQLLLLPHLASGFVRSVGAPAAAAATAARATAGPINKACYCRPLFSSSSSSSPQSTMSEIKVHFDPHTYIQNRYTSKRHPPSLDIILNTYTSKQPPPHHQVVHAPNEATLASMGVKSWPTWGCEASKFPWTYGEAETW